MSIIDTVKFTDFKSAGILFVTMTKASPKIHEVDGNRSFEWTVEVVSEVDNEWVRELEGTIPSANKYHSDAVNEKSNATIVVKPVDRIVDVSFTDRQSNLEMFKSRATVVNLKLNVNDKVQTFVGKLKLEFLDLGESAGLLDCLGRNLCLLASPVQTSFEFESSAAKVGDLVAAKVEDSIKYGIVTSAGSKIVFSDFGTEYTSTEVVSTLTVRYEPADLSHYTMKASLSGVRPSWSHIVSAIAASDIVESVPTVDEALMDEAYEIQCSGETNG